MKTCNLARWLGKYIQFCLVGGSGLIVDMALLYLLASPKTLGLNLIASKAIAAEVAILNNFLCNDLWTFRRGEDALNPPKSRWSRCWNFNLGCLTGVALCVILLDIQVLYLGWNAYIANFLAILLVSAWNFLICSRIAWKIRGVR